MPQAKNGLQELAGTRAQLVVVLRRVLEHVGKSLGWSIGWAAVVPSSTRHEEFSDVDLEGEPQKAEQPTDANSATVVSTAGILAQLLLDATKSLDQFRQNYEVCQRY